MSPVHRDRRGCTLESVLKLTGRGRAHPSELEGHNHGVLGYEAFAAVSCRAAQRGIARVARKARSNERSQTESERDNRGRPAVVPLRSYTRVRCGRDGTRGKARAVRVASRQLNGPSLPLMKPTLRPCCTVRAIRELRYRPIGWLTPRVRTSPLTHPRSAGALPGGNAAHLPARAGGTVRAAAAAGARASSTSANSWDAHPECRSNECSCGTAPT